MLLSWLKRIATRPDASGAQEEVQIADWPGVLKGMPAFSNLSDDAINELCARMEPVPVKKDDVIIREGDDGDCFYAIVRGTARVTRRAPSGAQPAPAGTVVQVAALTAGTGFGEEALISFRKRNATVTMAEDGLLLRISKDHFDDLLKKPRLCWVSESEASEAVSRGAVWLDVRTEQEHLSRCFYRSICIPLQNIRVNAVKLDKAKLYICFCENGRLSATAAFLLSQMGYRVAVLRGGLRTQQRGV